MASFAFCLMFKTVHSLWLQMLICLLFPVYFINLSEVIVGCLPVRLIHPIYPVFGESAKELLPRQCDTNFERNFEKLFKKYQLITDTDSNITRTNDLRDYLDQQFMGASSPLHVIANIPLHFLQLSTVH